jgi:hypothetical protein
VRLLTDGWLCTATVVIETENVTLCTTGHCPFDVPLSSLKVKLTDSVKLSSWDASGHSTCQVINRLLWNQKVHFRVHRSRALVPVLSQMMPIHIITPYLTFVLILWRAVATQRTAFYRCHIHGNEYRKLSNYTQQLGEILLPRQPICVSTVTNPE